MRIHVGAGGRIHGATIVGAQAGELISTFTVAVQSDGAIGAVEIAKAIMPYPTYAEAVKYCCNQYLLRQIFLLILSPFRFTDVFGGAGTTSGRGAGGRA